MVVFIGEKDAKIMDEHGIVSYFNDSSSGHQLVQVRKYHLMSRLFRLWVKNLVDRPPYGLYKSKNASKAPMLWTQHLWSYQKIIENPDFSEAPFSSIHGKTTCPTIQSSTKSSYISHPSSKPWMFFMFQQPMIDNILLEPMLLSSINHISGYGIKSYYIASW